MALVGAVHSVGASIARHLTGAYAIARAGEAALPEDDRTLPSCQFQQISGNEINTNFSPTENLITLHLFRMNQDKDMRSAMDPRFPGDPAARPLSLELHYLVTAWSSSAADEQTMMAWTMLELERTNLLDRSVLEPRRQWRDDESVQLRLSDIAHEDMMRIWDAMDPSYRLSVSYVAKPVRIETGRQSDSGPVIATRFEFDDHAPVPEDADA